MACVLLGKKTPIKAVIMGAQTSIIFIMNEKLYSVTSVHSATVNSLLYIYKKKILINTSLALT